MSAAQEITKLRKAGHLTEAYDRGYGLLKTNRDDERLKSAIGWVLHDKVKALVSEAKSHPNSASKSSEIFRSILKEYARLNLPRPDLLFSLLLSQATQFPDSLIFLPKFMMWAGLDSFRPEDFVVQINGGKTYASLVEKVARTLGKVARDLTLQDFLDIKEIHTFSVQLIDIALQKTNLQKPELLQYSKALILHSLGESVLAQDILIPFVRSKSDSFWTWQALANVVETSNPEKAIALYVKACLSCRDDEGFSVNVLESLSCLAAKQEKLGIAKWAANRAFCIRKQKEWNISHSLSKLIEAPWYADESVPSISKEALAQLASDAEMFIQAGLPQYDANYIDSFTNNKGKKFVKFGAVIDGEPQELTTPTRNVPSSLKFVAGEPVKLTVDAAKERLNITTVSQRQAGSLFDSMQCLSGQFRLHPKGFGFVDNVYVPPEIASKIEDGQSVSLAIIKKLDKKKNKWGLTAIAVIDGVSQLSERF